MLEFYTEEFRERASKQISEINEKTKDLLPVLEKWQMRGCMVLKEDTVTYYVPIKDEDDEQIGTKVTVINKITNESYLIVSKNLSYEFKKTGIDGTAEVYEVYLENGKLYSKNAFIHNHDYVIITEVEENGIIDTSIKSNLDCNQIRQSLSDIETFDKIECIKQIYFDKDKGFPRVRN